MGDVDCESEFTYFPSVPGESTRHLREQSERSQVLGIDASSDSETVLCSVRTLKSIADDDNRFGDIFRSHGLIDLVKIDAEGDELNILTGLGSALLSRIRQIVVEVYDIEDRLAQVANFLKKNLFTIVITPQVCNYLR